MIRSTTPYVSQVSRNHTGGLGSTITFLTVVVTMLAIAIGIG